MRATSRTVVQSVYRREPGKEIAQKDSPDVGTSPKSWPRKQPCKGAQVSPDWAAEQFIPQDTVKKKNNQSAISAA